MESTNTPKYAGVGLRDAKQLFVQHLKQVNTDLGRDWFPTVIVGPLPEDGQGGIPAEIAKVINEIQNILLNDDTPELGIRARAALVPIIKYRNPYSITTSEGAPPTHHTRYFGDLFTDDQHVVGLLSVLWPVFQVGNSGVGYAVTRNRFEERPITILSSVLCKSYVQALAKADAEASDRLKLLLRITIIHEMAHVLLERHMDPGGGAIPGSVEASQTPPELSIEYIALGKDIVMPGQTGEAGTVVEQALLNGLVEAAGFFLDPVDSADYSKTDGDEGDIIRYVKGSLAFKTYRILNPPEKISDNVERMIKYYFVTHYIKPEAIARQVQAIVPTNFKPDELTYLVSFGIEWEAITIRAYERNRTLPLEWTEEKIEGKLSDLVKEFQGAYAAKVAEEEARKRVNEESEKTAADNRGNSGDILKGRSRGAKNRAPPSRSTSRKSETKNDGKTETD